MMQITDRFNPVVNNIPEALSIYINQIVYEQRRRGHDITTLSLGEAFFDIPIFDFTKLDFVRGYHYSDSAGLPELRDAIASFYARQYGTPVSPDEILITAGSKIAIFMGILATAGEGAEVLIHEPAWLSYQEHVRLARSEHRFIPYYAPTSDFQKYFSPATRVLVINNPNNPAGRLYTGEEIRDLVEICRRSGVWLMVDEAYSDFLEPGQFRSALDFDAERDTVIIANSLSKNMGMSGWRIGYLIASPALLRQVLKLNQHLITCAPTILQAYLARYFDNIIDVTLPQAREIVFKRARVAERMSDLGLSVLDGNGTFYFFVSIADYPASSLDLALYLLLFHNIAVVPGSAYGASTERFLRISIGTESEERIEEALIVLRNTLARPQDVGRAVAERMQELGIPTFQEGRHG